MEWQKRSVSVDTKPAKAVNGDFKKSAFKTDMFIIVTPLTGLNGLA
jgi:hypothetical protein